MVYESPSQDFDSSLKRLLFSFSLHLREVLQISISLRKMNYLRLLLPFFFYLVIPESAKEVRNDVQHVLTCKVTFINDLEV